MRPVFLPDVPYGATTVREQWPDLPESLREAISSRLGGPIVAARGAGGGFTRAFAAVLETDAGLSAFVKAAPLQDPSSDLRIDDVLIDRSGKAWLRDWTWPCLGAPWFDAVTLLITAYASGADVDPLPGRRPAGRGGCRPGGAGRLLAD